MVVKGIAMAMVFGVSALGCSKGADPHPVSWYLAHESEMQAKVAWCLDDGERRQLPDCQNAQEAKRRTLVGSQRSLAPIDWGAPKSPR